MVSCDHNNSITLSEGHSANWSCRLRAAPNTTVTWLLDKSPLPPSLLEEECGEAVSASSHVEERADHLCYSIYTVSVQICVTDSSVEGDYVVMVGGEGGEILERTRVTLKLVSYIMWACTLPCILCILVSLRIHPR